jgi:hypothetical protein
MKKQIKLIAAFAAAMTAFSLSANAATIVPVTGITGHDGGNWPSSAGHLTDMVNATNPTLIPTSPTATPGMTMTGSDPAFWTWSGNYQQTWHANSELDNNTSANGKIGWVIMDFGTVQANLENMYMWATSTGQTGSGDEQVRDFNIYSSSGVGITTLPGMPNSKSTTGDYDFSVGDWSQVGCTQDLGTSSGTVNVIQSLGGISARYVAIEVITIGEMTDNRMAIAQVEFTAIPEPSSTALLGLGGLALIFRKRR